MSKWVEMGRKNELLLLVSEGWRTRLQRGPREAFRAWLLLGLCFAIALPMLLGSGVHALSQPADEALPAWIDAEAVDEPTLFDVLREQSLQEQYEVARLLPGESLAALLERLGALPNDAVAAMEAVDLAIAEASRASDQLVPALAEGATVKVLFDNRSLTIYQQEGGIPRPVLQLEVLATPTQMITAQKGDGFSGKVTEVDLEPRYVAVSGEIRRAFVSAALEAGVPRELVPSLADVFAFDVDFVREIYRGDRFEVVFEMLYDQEGRAVSAGDIVFAGLTWRGQRHKQAYYRFTPQGEDRAEFFAANGRNPRTLLMKTPINGAQVTSRFGPRRHPVLGYTIGHKGVDFGAAIGTPVLAAGDGRVSIASPRGTFGNYIRLQHQSGYETAYAHLSRFADGIEPGVPVKQGQVIGYVGMTGRTTGPHLHYEVLFEGEALDPQAAKVAVGDMLTGKRLESFQTARGQIDALRFQPFAVPSETLP
ncbi:MAG: M23 family metallopeptidase [Parvularculaceae bacterium]|nr:M23 family metallopeptidase [Parvularculaceae bacterium]